MGRGRGRVELKRIQNTINRQVTFSKRRNGLLKKAWELSILCDAEVALIIFSPTAKIHEFASHGMHNTLCKYKYFSGTTSNYNQDTQNIEYWHIEIERLKAKMADLERKQKHMIGEDLGSLSSNQLQRLERQLSGGVNKIRLRKRQILSERIGFLKRKSKICKNNLD
eukprot:Gb_30604 [translate_table: standard]